MNMDMAMVVKMELRPCLFRTKDTMGNGLFHTWHDGMAIVELKNGNIKKFEPEFVKFLDSNSVFDEYYFDETGE